MNDELRVLYIQPDKQPKEMLIDNELGAMQALVGGFIEVVHTVSGALIVCNEEGRINGMKPNRVVLTTASTAPVTEVFGPFFICMDGGEEFESLPDALIKRFTEWYRLADPDTEN